jgi:hypothetical protein
MTSNTFSGHWRVRITPTLEPITFVQLAERLNLPKSRACVPKGRNNEVRYAWINDFLNEKDAKEFVRQWSSALISGVTIKCVALPPKNDESNSPDSSDRGPKEPSTIENVEILPVPLMSTRVATSRDNTAKASVEKEAIKPPSHLVNINRKSTSDYHGSDQSPQRVQKPGELLPANDRDLKIWFTFPSMY